MRTLWHIYRYQDIGDKLIEVVGLENCLHMGQVKNEIPRFLCTLSSQVRTGLRSSGKRLAQCSNVKLIFYFCCVYPHVYPDCNKNQEAVSDANWWRALEPSPMHGMMWSKNSIRAKTFCYAALFLSVRNSPELILFKAHIKFRWTLPIFRLKYLTRTRSPCFSPLHPKVDLCLVFWT